MTADLGALQAAAVGVATELLLGEADWRVIDALVIELPDDAAPQLVTLIGTFGDNARTFGPDWLRRAGLHAARLQLTDP